MKNYASLDRSIETDTGASHYKARRPCTPNLHISITSGDVHW